MIVQSRRLKIAMVIAVFVVVSFAGWRVFSSIGANAPAKTQDRTVAEACQRAAQHPSGPAEGISVDEAICNGQIKLVVD